jgi:hypothetical protein
MSEPVIEADRRDTRLRLTPMLDQIMEKKFIFGSFSVITDNVSVAFAPTVGAK